MDFGFWVVILAPFVLIVFGCYLMGGGRDQRSGALAVFCGLGLYVVAASAAWGYWGLILALSIIGFCICGGFLLERFDQAAKKPQ
jgi:hypothetical protein